MAVELYQNDEREANNKEHNVGILRKKKKIIVWAKIVEEKYDNGSKIAILNKLFLLPISEEEQKTILSKDE